MKKLFSVRTIILAGSLLLQLNTLCFQSRGAAGGVDLSFDPGSGVNGPVNAVAVQPDGKLLIGGGFSTVRGLIRRGIARLKTDGSGDATFNPSGPMPSYSYSVALQPDGKVLVGHTNLSRLNADGSLDTGFTNNNLRVGFGDDELAVHSIAVQTDGKVLIAGTFYFVNGIARPLARLNANGSLDNSFVPATNILYVYNLTLQPDGKVLASSFFNQNGTASHTLMRLNSNGSLDNTFNPGEASIRSSVVQPDGKILVAGFFSTIQGTDRAGVARLNANGTLDLTFNQGINFPAPSDFAPEIALQADGKVLIWRSETGTTVRVNADGTPDNGFEPFNGSVAAIQPDAKILVYGGSGIERRNVDGTADSSYDTGTGVNDRIYSLLPLPNGKMVVAGSFTTVRGLLRTGMAQLNADGGGDSGFLHDLFPGVVPELILQPDGKILWCGGPFGRLNPDGTVDPTFNPDLGPLPPTADVFRVEVMAVQPDGKVLMAGAATGVRCEEQDVCWDTYTPFFHRFNTNGTRDTTFTPDTNFNVGGIVLQPDGKVLLGGGFTINSNSFGGVIRLNTNGTLDNTFTPALAWFGSLVLQPDGKVLLGGVTAVNGINQHGVARLNANGTLDNTFNTGSGPNGPVNAIALQPDGKVIIGGSFTSVNGTNHNCLARLNSNGNVDNTFTASLGFDIFGSPFILAIALQPDGRVLIAGGFLTVNGVVRPYVARLYGDSFVPLPSLNIARSNAFVIVSWPSPSTGFVLQQNMNLNTTNWTAPSETVTDDGIIRFITVSPAPGNRFYRLFKP